LKPGKWIRIETPKNINLHLTVTLASGKPKAVTFRYNGLEFIYCEDGTAEFRKITQWTDKHVHLSSDILGNDDYGGISIERGCHRSKCLAICGANVVGDTHRCALDPKTETWNTV